MKTITLFLLAALSGFLHAQGPLTPPAGPAPTMKSLDQIEPRTPISSVPYVISKSGSYYFTGNLVLTEEAGDAITITGSNVTLDLMGFTLSSKASVSGNGIQIPDSKSKGITIRNGFIIGNTIVTLSGSPQTWSVSAVGFDYGIRDSSQHASFEDLSIRGARTTGLKSSLLATLNNIRSWQNGSIGISGYGGSVSNSSAYENGSDGIYARFGTVGNSTAIGNGGHGIAANGGTVSDSNASYNGSKGIAASNGSVTGCSAQFNEADGIDSTNVASSTALGNGGHGILAFHGSVTGSTGSDSGGVGIAATMGIVTSSAAHNNKGYGISVFHGNVAHSIAASNTGPDVYALNSVVAYCRFATFSIGSGTRTGNFPSP